MHRSERTADTLKEEIGQIVGYELEDPRLTSVTVTDVRLSADKRTVRVYSDGREYQTLDVAGMLSTEECLPGLNIPVREVFEDPAFES